MGKTNSYAVIGSGLSALGACWSLINQGLKPIVYDIGRVPELDENQKRESLLLGRTSQDLVALDQRYDSLSPILNLPAFQNITEDFSPARAAGEARVVISNAAGGLANAWGAGSFRWSADDFQNFAFDKSELATAYDEVSRLFNVLWQQDDLVGDFGAESVPEQHPDFSAASSAVLENYSRLDSSTRKTVRLGRPRLAMNAHWREKNAARDLHPLHRTFFNPRTLFNSWVAQGLIEYKPQHHVHRLRQTEHEVELLDHQGANLGRAQFVFLAAGTLGSTKIIFQTSGERELNCPLLDNAGLIIPFIYTGIRLDAEPANKVPTFQLTALFDRYLCNFLDMSHLSATELMRYLPLPLPVLTAWREALIRRILVGYNFAPCEMSDSGVLHLTATRAWADAKNTAMSTADCQPLLRVMGGLGLRALLFAAKATSFGASIHYAGTFPYNSSPGRWQTDDLGRLPWLQRVHLVDGSTFPRLPAKNLSMTLTANAFRIAEIIAARAKMDQAANV